MKLDINKPNNPTKNRVQSQTEFSTEEMSNILSYYEMQIKTFLRFHLTPFRMTKIKITHADKKVEKREHSSISMRVQTFTETFEINIVFPRKFEN